MLPLDEMCKAVRDAIIGDDVYDNDPIVNKLETRAAEFVGKGAALFVPSRTMGN